MKGKIANFKAEKGFGFIIGEDSQKYFFHVSNVSNPMDIVEGYSVEFKTHEGQKGLNAISITVQTSLSDGKSKDKILKIANLRIRASDVKEYEVIKSMKNGQFEDENGDWHYMVISPLYDKDGCIAQPVGTILIDKCTGYYEKGYRDFESISNIQYKLDYQQFERHCYSLSIQTYTNGIRTLEFRSHNGSKNKEEAYKWLTYIDNEMDKLI